MRNISKFAETIKIYILYSVTFFFTENLAVYSLMWNKTENNVTMRRVQETIVTVEKQ